jgi:hypothetical protein
MNGKTVQMETETASPKTVSSQGGAAAELKASRNVQNALRAVASRLKAERVQLAVLLFDDEILVMAQGRLHEGHVREMTNHVLALTANLA